MNKVFNVCVGGPLCGQFKEVEPGRSTFHVQRNLGAMPHKLAALTYRDDAEVSYKMETYERFTMRAPGVGDASVSFWKHESLNGHEALLILVNSHGARRGHG